MIGCDIAEDLVVLVDGVRVPELRGRGLRRRACAARCPAHRLDLVEGRPRIPGSRSQAEAASGIGRRSSSMNGFIAATHGVCADCA